MYHIKKEISSTVHWQCWRRTCRVKLMSSFFHIDTENAAIKVIHLDDRNHEMDDRVIAYDQFLNQKKGQLLDDPTKPVKRLYDQVALAYRNAAMRDGRD